MLDNQENRILKIGFESGLIAGRQAENNRIFSAISNLHLHNEHGAIVYLDDLTELLRDFEDEPEGDLS
jgi:hypothetical protein